MKLKLCAPLFYESTGNLPCEFPENAEFLFCYGLNSAQSRSIEPERGLFLDNLLFSARKTADSGVNPAGTVQLPAGNYLFAQYRRSGPPAFNSEEWLDLAIEQQKDGLWERHKLESMVYIRYLYEDGGFATQLFRPVES